MSEINVDNEKEILIVKVGNDERPASQEDIDNVIAQFKKAGEDDDGAVTIVTHHAISFETIKRKFLKNVIVENAKDDEKK